MRGLAKMLWYSVPEWARYLTVWVCGFLLINIGLLVFGDPPQPWGAVVFWVALVLWLGAIARARYRQRNRAPNAPVRD